LKLFYLLPQCNISFTFYGEVKGKKWHEFKICGLIMAVQVFAVIKNLLGDSRSVAVAFLMGSTIKDKLV
jgi:hypothetical protein